MTDSIPATAATTRVDPKFLITVMCVSGATTYLLLLLALVGGYSVFGYVLIACFSGANLGVASLAWGWWRRRATATEDAHLARKWQGRPLRVNGKPIPPDILNGPPGDFARFCGETDPAVLALLDAEADDDAR